MKRYDDNSLVELDLLALHKEIAEKLQVVNGKCKRKTRSRKSKSPQDGSSPTSPQSPKPGKCGRPANPIPRHKRESHIKAEHRRRDKIQKGFETLRSLVPELEDVSEKESKAVMLFKTAEHCRQLKGQCRALTDEAAALRKEIQALGTQIHDLQLELPVTGIDVVEKEGTDIDQMYQDYVVSQTRKNWKFWLFTFMIKPLFESFKTMVTTSTTDEFSRSVTNWVKEKLSLPRLRLDFLSALTRVSKETKIMDQPQLLPEEARQSTSSSYEDISLLPEVTLQSTVSSYEDISLLPEVALQSTVSSYEDTSLKKKEESWPCKSLQNGGQEETEWGYSLEENATLKIEQNVAYLPPLTTSSDVTMITSLETDVWENTFFTTAADFNAITTCENVVSNGCHVNGIVSNSITDAIMSTDSSDMTIHSISDLALPACDTDMSIIDPVLLNGLVSTDTMCHFFSEQPATTISSEAFNLHSQPHFTTGFTTPQSNHTEEFQL